jgi:Na+/H+-translocating membrane pyrophosphatase
MRFWEGATIFVLFLVISALVRRVGIHLAARAHVRRVRAAQQATMTAWRERRAARRREETS